MKPTLTLLATILLAICLMGGSCWGPVKPDPKIPDDSEMCADACDNLRNLGCEEGEDLPDSEGNVVTCEIFCLETQGKGHALNPTCVAKITACDQLEPECSEK